MSESESLPSQAIIPKSIRFSEQFIAPVATMIGEAIITIHPRTGSTMAVQLCGYVPCSLDSTVSQHVRRILWFPLGYLMTLTFLPVVHLVQALWWRRWFLFPTIVLGGLGEIIGWAARTWSAKNKWLDKPFLMQISTTIIACVRPLLHCELTDQFPI
jgi:hypothetical protein